MKAIRNLFSAILMVVSGLSGPNIKKKAADDMATLTGIALKPLIKGKDYSVQASATFKVAGYYQFYAYMEDLNGTKVWTCGSVTSRNRSVGQTVTISGTFPSSLQGNHQFLYFYLYCTTGDYSGYRLSPFAHLPLVDSQQYINPAERNTITFPGQYHYWEDNVLKIARETLAIPEFGYDLIDPPTNRLSIANPHLYFDYRNAATNNAFGSNPTAELWLLNHFEDFVGGAYYSFFTPKRRVFPMAVAALSTGSFYFACTENFIYDRRNLQQLKATTTTPGETFGSNAIFFPIGLGRDKEGEEPYRWRLIVKNFTAANHYLEFNGTFKRTKEDMGFAIDSHYYVHVN